MIAYLSGAMENAKDEGANWRNEINIWLKENLNHDVIDPIIETERLIKKYDQPNYRDYKKSNPDKFLSVNFLLLSSEPELLAFSCLRNP